MKIIDYNDIDFVNYKLPSMYIIMPHCSFKCDKECGRDVCQNSKLAHMHTHDISINELIDDFDNTPMSQAIVFGGLEPLDDAADLQAFVSSFRYNHSEPIVIYTGYTEDEVREQFSWLFIYENIVIKFGRFIPDQESHFDEVLGVTLASPNQYAKEINFDLTHITLSITTNPNEEEYSAAVKAVEANDGYCPCELFHTIDTKCMCKSFREQEYEGLCHCGRYLKVYKEK